MGTAPEDFGSKFVPAYYKNARLSYSLISDVGESKAYASKTVPSEWGIKRGAWKRMVDTIQWYTVRPIANARLPGSHSAKTGKRYVHIRLVNHYDLPGRE